MDQESMVDQGKPLEGKGPLQSRTLWLGAITLVGGIVANRSPAAGEFIKAHAEEILGVIGAAAMYFRPGSTSPINWKDWTIFGVGKKF